MMPTPGEHKTVHPPPLELQRTGARILAYAEAIHLRRGYGEQVGWTIVSREEAEKRRAPSPQGYGGTRGNSFTAEHIKRLSLFLDDLLDATPSSAISYAVARVREFNPRYAEAAGTLLEQFPPLPMLRRTSRHIHTDITMSLS